MGWNHAGVPPGQRDDPAVVRVPAPCSLVIEILLDLDSDILGHALGLEKTRKCLNLAEGKLLDNLTGITEQFDCL